MEDYGYSNYKLFLSGDLQGFENIVKYYRNNLILFIAQYAHDFQLAEDISQEVFVKLYLKKPNYAKQASFKTWLYIIAKRDAISYAKKHKLQLRANDNGSLGVEEEFLDIIIADERKKALHNALNELCDKYRNVLYLAYFEDFSVREISVTEMGYGWCFMKALFL